MAGSYSDMMNEPAVYGLGDDSSSSASSNRSASLPMQHNQMMTSPVAPHHYHMPMPYKGIDPVASQLMHSSKQYLADHVTPAPVVKSQAHQPYFMPSVTQPAGFVYNPTTAHATTTNAAAAAAAVAMNTTQPTNAPTSPMDYAMLSYTDQYMMPQPVSSPMMVDYHAFQALSTAPDNSADIAAAMYSNNAVYHAPPAYTPVVPSNTKMQMVAQPSMMMLMMSDDHQQQQATLPKAVSRRRSTITAKDAPELQPNQAEAKMKTSSVQPQTTRRNMPRRHTVSGPYRPSSSSSSAAAAAAAAAQPKSKDEEKYRKLLKAKRHRSLGKLEMPGGSPVDASKWLSPETASSSSSMCSPTMGAGEAFDEQMLLMDKLGQPAGDTPQDDEEEKYQCLWESCYLEMRTLDELIMHVKDMHIGSGKALYYCGWKDCPRNQKPFTKRHKMHNHLRTHTGERPFECTEPGCGKRFSRPDSLTTHSKIHSNVRPYLCQFENCGKAYYHLRSLRKHERTHETRYFDAENPMHDSATSVAHAADNPLVPQGDTALLDWCGTQTSF